MEAGYRMLKEDQVILVNVIEVLVKKRVKQCIKELGGCDCEVCYLNACALALNALKPQYVTTTKGALITEAENMESKNQINILVEVTKAVMKVMKAPHHKN